MNDDIVTRLRNKYQGQLPIMLEAADEIEELRTEIYRLQRLLAFPNSEERLRGHR